MYRLKGNEIPDATSKRHFKKVFFHFCVNKQITFSKFRICCGVQNKHLLILKSNKPQAFHAVSIKKENENLIKNGEETASGND